MDLSGAKLREQVTVTLQNAELLRHTFNTLQSLVAERKNKTGFDYCEAYTLSAAAKIVYERWEREKRMLPRQDLLASNTTLLRQGFYPEDLPFPEELREQICNDATRCTWYKMIWGTGPK